MKFRSDIDIDLGDRMQALSHIQHIPAALRDIKPIRRHSSGVYVTDIPYDPVNNMSAIDYQLAEDRGYVKLDLLNVWLYKLVRDEAHLVELMREPDWSLLEDESFVEKLIHLGSQFHNLQKMPEPVNSIPRLAMFLAVIRPGKLHLIGKPWAEVASTIWQKDSEGFTFKKAHSLSYAVLVCVHMNLLKENPEAFSLLE
jgi:hypothetical protein